MRIWVLRADAEPSGIAAPTSPANRCFPPIAGVQRRVTSPGFSTSGSVLIAAWKKTDAVTLGRVPAKALANGHLTLKRLPISGQCAVMEAQARYWRPFAHGECIQAIVKTLRDASELMATADLVERVALDCRSATGAPDVAATLLAHVRAALAKLDKRGIVSGEGKPARWSVANSDAIQPPIPI